MAILIILPGGGLILIRSSNKAIVADDGADRAVEAIGDGVGIAAGVVGPTTLLNEKPMPVESGASACPLSGASACP